MTDDRVPITAELAPRTGPRSTAARAFLAAKGGTWRSLGLAHGLTITSRSPRPPGTSDHYTPRHAFPSGMLTFATQISPETLESLRRLLYAPLWPDADRRARDRVLEMRAWSRRRGRRKGRA